MLLILHVILTGLQFTPFFPCKDDSDLGSQMHIAELWEACVVEITF